VGFEWFIVRRDGRLPGGFRRLSNIITAVGVALGVACLIVVLSVVNGFHYEIKEKILKWNPDVIITKFFNEPFENPDSIIKIVKKNIKGIKNIYPYIFTKGVIKSDYAQEGVMIKAYPTDTLQGLALGKSLSDVLKVIAGDTVKLFGFPLSKKSRLLLKTRKYKVDKIFDTGLYDYNVSLTFMSLRDAQKFFGLKNKVTGIEMKLENPYDADKVRDILNDVLPYPFRAVSWTEVNSTLFSALKLEKTTLFILLTLIIVVACFAISASMLMLVTRKSREIGVLKALGATNKSILKLFTLRGLLIGLKGIVCGTALGYVLCVLLKKYHFVKLPAEIYNVMTLPVKMRWQDFLLVCGIALILVLISAVYPAKKAAELMPAEVLRYE